MAAWLLPTTGPLKATKKATGQRADGRLLPRWMTNESTEPPVDQLATLQGVLHSPALL